LIICTGRNIRAVLAIVDIFAIFALLAIFDLFASHPTVQGFRARRAVGSSLSGRCDLF
jgi:hypothetical protein